MLSIRCYVCSRSDIRAQISLDDEAFERSDDDIPRDTECLRELPRGRQPYAGAEPTLGDGLPETEVDLTLHADPEVAVHMQRRKRQRRTGTAHLTTFTLNSCICSYLSDWHHWKL